jgi:hypothetical protein
VIYPVYLVIIAIPPPVRSRWPRIYMPLRTAVGVLILRNLCTSSASAA